MRQNLSVFILAVFLGLFLIGCQAAPEATPTPAATPFPAVAQTAQQALARQQQIDDAAITIVSVTPTVWPDSCLGVAAGEEICAQAETPGFIVVLQLKGNEYVYHTSETGNQMRLAAAPEPAADSALVTWSRHTERRCDTAVITQDTISAGQCDGGLLPAPLSAARQQELAHFVETFAGFTVETAVGEVTLNGAGSETAVAAYQRALAEWTQLAAYQAQSGRNNPNYGAVVTYQRQGGIAGFCDTTTIYSGGYATVSNCSGEQTAKIWLNAADLTTLYEMQEKLSSFNVTQSDDAVADSLTTTLTVSGTGTSQGSIAERELLTEMATNILAAANNP